MSTELHSKIFWFVSVNELRINRIWRVCNRLNYRLSVACETTIAEKCADSCSGIGFNVEHPCGGKVSAESKGLL